MVILLAMLGLMALAIEAAAQVPVPGKGSSRARKPGEQLEAAQYPVFEFHSGFWNNLHHVLYEQARIREQRPLARPETPNQRAGTLPKLSAGLPGPGEVLTAEEARAWGEAVDYYVRTLGNRDLLFDSDMTILKNRLVEMANCGDLSGRSGAGCASGLKAELVAALESAAGVYRARWWNEHDRANRAWIAAATPLVQEHGTLLAEQLARVYQSEWPTKRIRVDVCVYAGVHGGYTTLDPLHITISSGDVRNQGAAALEVLFHEASHDLAEGVRNALLREYRQRSKPVRRELWDAILFYTTTEFVKQAISREGTAGRKRAEQEAYWDRHRLTARGWQNFQRALDRHWKPYLEAVMLGSAGPDDIERALARVVEAL